MTLLWGRLHHLGGQCNPVTSDHYQRNVSMETLIVESQSSRGREIVGSYSHWWDRSSFPWKEKDFQPNRIPMCLWLENYFFLRDSTKSR
jgi:hypothetical protein